MNIRRGKYRDYRIMGRPSTTNLFQQKTGLARNFHVCFPNTSKIKVHEFFLNTNQNNLFFYLNQIFIVIIIFNLKGILLFYITFR